MLKVNVVFDSSGLRTNTDAIVCSKFESFLKEFSDKCNLKIYIPEVVRGELCYQKFSIADEKLDKVKKSLSRIGEIVEQKREIPYKTEELRLLVEKRFDKWAKKKNIIFLKTPYSKISLKELQEKSIWRVPPFDDIRKKLEHCKKCRAEKGFRDALILYSVLELVKKTTRNKVYFICGDKLLLEAVDKYKKNKRLVTYKAIKELSSRLRLSLKKDNDKWINDISEKAREVFLYRVWQECKIEEKIEEEHSWHFRIPSTSEFRYLSSWTEGIKVPGFMPETKLIDIKLTDIYEPISLESPTIRDVAYGIGESECVPLNEGGFYVDSPIFQEVKDNNIYIWKSGVSHHREYREPWDTGVIAPKVYKIHFDVIWSAKVTKDEQFDNLKQLNIEFLSKGFDFSLSLY
ncbi:MAG: DUF4935 domain-containing protein [Candidatus Aminicenantes bacterium]|nr:DUF4935 domain-containing protein [Candidatus Aminicenantes bacterium]